MFLKMCHYILCKFKHRKIEVVDEATLQVKPEHKFLR